MKDFREFQTELIMYLLLRILVCLKVKPTEFIAHMRYFKNGVDAKLAEQGNMPRDEYSRAIRYIHDLGIEYQALWDIRAKKGGE